MIPPDFPRSLPVDTIRNKQKKNKKNKKKKIKLKDKKYSSSFVMRNTQCRMESSRSLHYLFACVLILWLYSSVTIILVHSVDLNTQIAVVKKLPQRLLRTRQEMGVQGAHFSQCKTIDDWQLIELVRQP